MDPILSEYRRTFIKQAIPDLIRERKRRIAYATSCSAFLMLIQLEPRFFSLSLRAVTPLPD